LLRFQPFAPGKNATMGEAMTTHFIVHDKKDTVGVIVVEDVKPEMNLTGWIMETDETIRLKAKDAIPLGHKVALKDIVAGETLLKYGHDIGKSVASIGKGRHAHVHNVKTKRW
jgi:(2R)-sulfolactate sulfo-lyase subunit alpha